MTPGIPSIPVIAAVIRFTGMKIPTSLPRADNNKRNKPPARLLMTIFNRNLTGIHSSFPRKKTSIMHAAYAIKTAIPLHISINTAPLISSMSKNIKDRYDRPLILCSMYFFYDPTVHAGLPQP